MYRRGWSRAGVRLPVSPFADEKIYPISALCYFEGGILYLASMYFHIVGHVRILAPTLLTKASIYSRGIKSEI